MVRASLLSIAFVVVSLSSVVGCGASAPRASANAPSMARDDSSWCSPEEAETKMLEKAATPAPVNAAAPRTVVQSYRHNEGARPAKGAIHAAAY